MRPCRRREAATIDINQIDISQTLQGIFPVAPVLVTGVSLTGGSGMSVSVDGFRMAHATDNGLQWTLRRNCSVTPAQLWWTYGLLCAVSLAVAGFFWWQGATLVLPFAALELLAVGVAFLFYSRHAVDREQIRVSPGLLVVEREVAGRVSRSEFPGPWVEIALSREAGQLVEVRSGVRSERVGRYLRADLRPALARELRRALAYG